MKLSHLLCFLFPVNLFAQNFTYTAKPTLLGVGNSSSIAFDADNDGKTDLLIMGKSGTSYYTKLYHNNGDTTFLDLGIPFPGLAYGSADVLDYNNDGLLDIVLCGFDGTNKRFCLYKNIGNNLFLEVPVSISGVDYGTVKCADLNGDGWTDIVVSGQSATQKIFKIYRNNGNGAFTEANSLEGMYDGGFVVADINNDTYPDIIASGVNNSSELTGKIYMNGKKDFAFTERTSNITAIRGGEIKNIDFNNDGYSDIIITGKNTSDVYVTEVYKNNSGTSFTLFSSLKGLYYSSSAIGDFNNDGFPDIILSGLDAGSGFNALYYLNNAGLGFTLNTTNLPNINKGYISAMNLTNDSKLDVLISGYSMSGPVTYVYNNNVAALNIRPDAPSNLSSYSLNDSVILTWKRPQDTETKLKGLTYDFYIKKVLSGDTVFTVPSDYLAGNRYVFKQGGLQDTFIVIKNMPYGKYYWSVQAVDQGYKGSAFATQAEFNICHNLTIGRDTSICKGSSIALSAGNSSDVVNWYSSENPAHSFHNGNVTTIDVFQNSKVWAIVNTSIGCTLSDTINLSYLPLPQTNLISDTGICVHTNLSLALAQNGYVGDWSSAASSVLATGKSTISFNVLHNDTIYVKIKDSNGCINYDTTKIKAYSLPESYLPSDTSECFHSTLHLTAGQTSDSVYWFSHDGKLLKDKRSISYYTNYSEKLYIRIINNLKCSSTDSILVTMLPLPVFNAGWDTLICPGGHAILGSQNVQQGNFLYEWTPSKFLDNSHIAQPSAFPDTSTEYIVKITDSNLCVNYDSVKVNINPSTTLNSGGDKSICIGKNVLLGGNPTATGSILPYNYQWFPRNNLDNSSIANPTASPDSTTLYNLIVFTGNCILDTLSVKVTVWPLPIVTKSNDVIIGYQENTQIWASGGSQYKWEPVDGLNNGTTSSPNASPESTTTYSVLVTDVNGCESSSQVKVSIKNEVFVPNLFTPNGDGKNDYFMIFGTGIAKILLRVYSQEGILVYETSNVEYATKKGWDGNYQGNPLNAGKYLWLLEAASTDSKPLIYNGSNKGIITLLR